MRGNRDSVACAGGLPKVEDAETAAAEEGR
jgi:hypothetical protein